MGKLANADASQVLPEAWTAFGMNRAPAIRHAAEAISTQFSSRSSDRETSTSELPVNDLLTNPGNSG
jgi:hypothetical protein